jgi:hypothetical protein
LTVGKLSVVAVDTKAACVGLKSHSAQGPLVVSLDLTVQQTIQPLIRWLPCKELKELKIFVPGYSE